MGTYSGFIDWARIINHVEEFKRRIKESCERVAKEEEEVEENG
jgi:predicted ATP-grasp superfamily ATP-dependent carboligase